MTVVAWIPGHSASYLGSSSSIPGTLAFLGRACLPFFKCCACMPGSATFYAHPPAFQARCAGQRLSTAGSRPVLELVLEVSQVVRCFLVRGVDQIAEAVQSVAWEPAEL